MTKLDIPFIKSRGEECGQTCTAMMIKYFKPDFEPDIDEFNKIIHFKKDTYTFPLQNAILLNHYGIETKCYSSDDCPTTKEVPDIFQQWYGNDYDSIKHKIDVEAYNWMVGEGRKKSLFTRRSTPFAELLYFLSQKQLVCLVIDWNRLNKETGKPFHGHFILLTGYDEKKEVIFLHDPDNGPFQEYPRDTVENAYNHPAMTDDVFIAFGLKNNPQLDKDEKQL